jgi:S1-C subfamily serine protease
MSKEDAPAIGSYLGVAVAVVLGLLTGLGRLTGSDDSTAIAFFPFAMAIGSSSTLGPLIALLVGAVQWPIYGFVVGAMISAREPLSLPYATGLGLVISHIALAAYLGQ